MKSQIYSYLSYPVLDIHDFFTKYIVYKYYFYLHTQETIKTMVRPILWFKLVYSYFLRSI